MVTANTLVNPCIVAKPFVKWAGGKQALAAQLIGRFPDRFDRYFEPFFGGGSVFFGLGWRHSVVGDLNRWLVDTYVAVRDRADEVAAALERLPNTKEDFLRIRAADLTSLDDATRAAHLIYLNKTCFRGLFRINRKGQFNVPYGAYRRRYFDPENLRAVSVALASAEIRHGDFEFALDGIQSTDFAYMDPPYYKLGGYSDFNRYTHDQFRAKDHLRLASVCRELDTRGVRWALSNSDTPFVRSLYDGFNIEEINSRREINLSSKDRDMVELVITNYESGGVRR